MGVEMGTFVFWVGAVTFYVLVWLNPLLSETRQWAMWGWMSSIVGGLGLMIKARTDLGHTGWEPSLARDIFDWLIIIFGLLIALRKPPKRPRV